MRGFLSIALAVAATLFAPHMATAQGAGDCSTPRRAAGTWLTDLSAGGAASSRAIECFDWSGAGVSGDDRARRVARLRQILNRRALSVALESLPDEPSPPGKDHVQLIEGELPDLYYVRRDGRWVMSAESIRAISVLYEDTLSIDIDAFVRGLPSWLKGRVFGISWWQMVGVLFAILAAFLCRAIVAWIVAAWGARLVARKGGSSDQTLLGKASRPIGTAAMAGLLWYVWPLLRFTARVNQVANAAIRVLAAVAAVMVLYRLVDVVSRHFEARAAKTDTKLDDQLVPLVRKSSKVFVGVIGVIFVLQNMDVDVTSLLAMGTVGTLAVSFAAKDIIANLFGSFSIFAERPFQIGDWVAIGGTEGVVEEVGMRSTRIRTFYNSVVTLPNSVITVTAVDNYGARQFRRTNVTLNLAYDTTPEQIEAFCSGVRAILQANTVVRKDYYEVHFQAFGASSLDIMLYFFLKTGSWSEELRERHLLYLEILRLARDLAVEFAFPTQTLHLASAVAPAPAKERPAPSDESLAATVMAFGPDGGRSRPKGPKISPGFWAGEPVVSPRSETEG